MTSPRDVIANAAYTVSEHLPGESFGRHLLFSQRERFGDAVLAALTAAGYAVVPVEPTEAMIQAMHNAPEPKTIVATPYGAGYAAADQWRETWRAALAAAPRGEGG